MIRPSRTLLGRLHRQQSSTLKRLPANESLSSLRHLVKSSFSPTWRACISRFDAPSYLTRNSICEHRRFSQISQKRDLTIDEVDRYSLDPHDEAMLNELLKYKELHGDCHVPGGTTLSREQCERLGVSEELSTWVYRQRQRYKNIKNGKIKKMTKQDQVRIVVLESMGFMWFEREAQWQRSFNRCEAHLKRYGTLNINQQENPQLWSWADQQRKAFGRGKLSEERTNLLKEIGFVFDLQEAAWWHYFERLCAFTKEHGNANAPTQGKEDPSLGTWVARQRRHHMAGELTQERVDALKKIGFSFDVHGERWMMHYKRLVDFYEKNGHTRVPVSEGALWQWVDRQRRKLRQQQGAGLEDNINSPSESVEKIMALNKIHFDWSVADGEERAKRLMDLTFSVDIQDERWVENYTKLCAFKERFGHFSIPPKHADYQELASWAKHQRYLNKQGRLPPERIAALDELGFIWSGQGARWDKFYQELVRFRAKNGHARIPTHHRELHRWITQQRKILKGLEGTVSQHLPVGLQDAKMCFDPRLRELEKMLYED